MVGLLGLFFSCSGFSQSTALSQYNRSESKSPPFKNVRVGHPKFKTLVSVRATHQFVIPSLGEILTSPIVFN
jgi:hypothetical protein